MSVEPEVIEIRSFGTTENVTLRDYVQNIVQDWEIGLETAESVLEAFEWIPDHYVYNEAEFLSSTGDVENVQLHKALDPELLRTEIQRLRAEEIE